MILCVKVLHSSSKTLSWSLSTSGSDRTEFLHLFQLLVFLTACLRNQERGGTWEPSGPLSVCARVVRRGTGPRFCLAGI